jgi:hypothetical protein
MTLEAGKAEEDDAVPAMKLTPNAAMRARDVSRPRPEHLAEAEGADASYPSGPRGSAASAGGPRSNEAADAARGNASREGEETDGTRSRAIRPERTGRPDGGRRRQVSRDSPGRGEPSRGGVS